MEKVIKIKSLFVQDKMKRLNPGTFSHNFAGNGLPQIRFYDLRHTASSLLLSTNVPAKVTSEILGHSTIGITMDLYSHVMPTMREEAANKLDRLFNTKYKNL